MANSAIKVYTSTLGIATISTPNSNLDGSGTIENLLTGGSDGTFVKTILIKALTDSSEGMIRLFLKKPGGGSFTLIREIYVSPTIKSGRDLSFYCIIPIGIRLAFEDVLGVSTENGDSFNVIAESFDISYISSSIFLGNTSEYITNTGVGSVSVANSNLDGTGTLVKLLTTGGSADYNGCVIRSILIKAQESTTSGMVRLYIQSGSGSKYLFHEVVVPNVTQSSHLVTFQYEAILGGSFCLPPDFSLWASTENAETFSIICEAQDWKYV